MRHAIDADVEVAVPANTAYTQWTKFESFPQFMSGVESIEQVSDTRTHWVVKIAGVERQFDADTTEQVPGKRVSWTSINEPHHSGTVQFETLENGHTRVDLHMEWEPAGFVEKAGAALQIDDVQVRADLHRFKKLVESH